MLFRAVLASIAAATVAFGAAVPGDTEVGAHFNPSGTPLATPVFEETDNPMTNAERLRKGMAPLPPKMKKRGLILHPPGPVGPGAPPTPSAAPPQPSGGSSADPPIVFEGIVQITDATSGKVLGYVSDKLTKVGQLGVDINYRTPLEVTFSTTRANQKPASIEITNGDSRSGKYFGAVASEWSSNGHLGKGKDSFTYLTRTGETKSGLGPMNVANAILSMLGKKLKSESAIWTANQFTGELASSWTNTGGQTVDTTVFYYKSLGALALSSDGGAFKAANKDAVEVKLNIIAKPFY